MGLGILGWRELDAAHRRWIVVNALAVTAVINTVLNAAIAWISVRGEHTVPLWSLPLVGRPSTVTDTVGTLFFLPLITTLLCTSGVRRELRAGRLEPLPGPGPGWTGRLTGGRLRRGLVLGGLCTVVLSPLAVALLVGIDFGSVSRTEFVVYKAVFCVLLGAVVTPIIAVRAMADPPPVEPAVALDSTLRY